MRLWLLTAPRWVLVLVNGGLFAAFWIVWSHVVQERAWTESLITALLTGAVFGAFMGPYTHRLNEGLRAAVGTLTREVRRAGWRGPAPADPEVRAAALRLVDHQQGEWQRRRTLNLTLFCVMTVLYAALAVTWSPWFWLASGFFAGMLVFSLAMDRWMSRRRQVLRGEPARD